MEGFKKREVVVLEVPPVYYRRLFPIGVEIAMRAGIPIVFLDTELGKNPFQEEKK